MRKRLISLVALLTVFSVFLAACGKSGGDTTQQPSNTNTNAPKEAAFHGAWQYDVPPKSHFNVFSTGALTMPGSPYTELMTPPLATYLWADDKYELLLAEDWKKDDAAKTITVTLKKGVKWSDGTEVKAQDVLTYMSIGKAKAYTVWRYVSKVEAKDDYTVVFTLSNPATIATRYILRLSPQPTSVYGEWAKKYEALYAAGKAATSDEVKALNKELDAFRPADYVASGPYKMDTKNITEAQLTLAKRTDGGLHHDKVKIDKVVIYNGETAQATPLILDKKVDFATHAFPPATEKQFTEQGIRIIRFPFGTGPAIFFNHNQAPFNTKEFRQALAYAINRDEAGLVALGKSGVGVKKMAGLADSAVDAWMTPADAGKLNPYAYNQAKAEEILKSIGWKKGADGQWTDKDGKKAEYEIHVPSDFTDWAAAAENIAQQLSRFGIKTAVRGIPWAQYVPDMYAGKFQFGMLPWGSSIPHPQFAFLADYVNYNAGGQKGDKEKPGINYPLKQGGLDLDALITEVGVGTDAAKTKEAIGKLALHLNENLPIIPVFERYANSPTLENVHVSGWPAESDKILKNGGADSFVTILIYRGVLTGAK